jgi:hypothetical protein
MTLQRLTLKTIALALAVAALGASAASATPMTYQERQAIASRGIGAPTPPVTLGPGGYLPGPSRAAEPVQTPQAKSSDGTDWGAIAALVAAGLAACVALGAVRHRHTPATPR